MKSLIWTKAIKESADPKRAKHFLDLLGTTTAGGAVKTTSAEQAQALAALFSGSQALSTLLIAHPDWLSSLAPEALRFPRQSQGLRAEVGAWLEPLLQAGGFATALAHMRLFKQREMLRIGVRDLIRPGHPEEITQEISNLADVCLETVWRICRIQLGEKYGEPYHQDSNGVWHKTAACVIGLGKLGGQELNYSSDVDIIFVYEEEGSVFRPTETARVPDRHAAARIRMKQGAAVSGTGLISVPEASLKRPTLTNHQFYNRLAESFVAELTRLAPEGMLYRIDLRLRPEGDAGPLSRSLSGYENYYAQWGQTWERMMLIKARHVAGDEAVAAEFLEMVQPFRYPRSINENVLREVAAMKVRIENEVIRAGELERNVKLGRGGIREIEFIAQVLQLLHAGRQPFLQGSQTLPCLEKLRQYEILTLEESQLLAQAYRFLRDLEHRLQMEENRQTHTIPADRPARERLARLMGFDSLKAFESAHQKHTRDVRRLFEKILPADVPDAEAASSLPRDFKDGDREWKSILAQHGFKDIAKALRVLREFVEGPGYVHVSPRTMDLALQLLQRLFSMCRGKSEIRSPKSEARSPKSKVAAKESRVEGRGSGVDVRSQRLSDPDRVVTRLDNFIAAYGARATLFELWNGNPAIFDLLVLLFDRSEFLAEMAIRTPDLVDELVTSGRLRQRKTTEETLRDLQHGKSDADQHRWLRRYHQAELMRIGLRDILGLAEPEQYLSELSALADACLQYTLEVVMRKKRLKKPPFVIVGLGKLGGQEIDYGSDLDIVFVAPAEVRNLTNLGRLAVQIMDLLSARTADGLVFHTDARLRPDGEKGLLVNTIAAYEQYYRRRSQLWEIQSLTRTRPIAGNLALGEQFQALAGRLTNFARPSLPLAAYAPDWKEKIHRMRMRIEKERTPAGKNDLAIKTGKGGLMDVEFIAQILCLEQGWQEANTLHALQRGREAGALPRPGELIQNYQCLRHVEGILRRWSYEGETVLPDDPAPYYRVAIRCGFPTPEAFRQAVASWREMIREMYLKVINS